MSVRVLAPASLHRGSALAARLILGVFIVGALCVSGALARASSRQLHATASAVSSSYARGRAASSNSISNAVARGGSTALSVATSTAIGYRWCPAYADAVSDAIAEDGANASSVSDALAEAIRECLPECPRCDTCFVSARPFCSGYFFDRASAGTNFNIYRAPRSLLNGAGDYSGYCRCNPF
ncbi:unnamed protein product [Pedinophyceae sp. YPF-701]|nr:unnamed protein product [Pedinophyceae sp. YPF-701]